jgi:hypothetical protein
MYFEFFTKNIRITNFFILKILMLVTIKINITGVVMSCSFVVRNLITSPQGITFHKTVIAFLFRYSKIEHLTKEDSSQALITQ